MTLRNRKKMNRMFIVAIAMAIAGYFNTNASASILVLQDGLNSYTGTTDTYMDSSTNAQHNDYGDAPDLMIREQTGNDKHSLLRFDLSSLPVYSTIASVTSVTLSLYKAEGDQNPYNVRVFAVTNGPWNEGDGDKNTDGHADWVHRMHNASNLINAWNTPGLGVTDYNPLSDPMTMITLNHQWYDWNVTSIVTAWWSGASSNYGFFLDSVGAEGERHFNSSENSNNRPKLTIDYTPKGGPDPLDPTTPEPASLAFLGLGAAGLFLRRRKV